MEPGWNTVVQAVIVSACSWYLRRGNKKDSKSIKDSSNQATDKILERLGKLESDMALVKKAVLPEHEIVRLKTDSKGKGNGKSIRVESSRSKDS